jgi:hypothetical protein
MELIAITELAAIGLEIPNFQRFRDELKISEIIAYQANYHDKHAKYNFYGVIAINYVGGVGYILDGQHRFYAMLELAKMRGNFKVFIQSATVATMDEMHQNFKMINLNTLMPDIATDVRDVCEQIFNHFRRKYPGMISPKHNCQRPRIYEKKFIEFIAIFYVEQGDKTIKQVIELLEVMNSKSLLVNVSSAKIIATANKHGFYLGCMSKSKDWIASNTNEIRRQVWSKNFGKSTEGACVICSNAIHILDFICGRSGCDEWEPVCTACA